MTNAIYKQVAERLAEANGRVVVCVAMAGCAHRVYAPADLPKFKAEGNGLRIGKLFVFASQVRFARMV